MKRKLNFTFLCALILGTIIFAGSVHVLHSFQMGRNADLFRDMGEGARGRGDLNLACRYFDRYLRLTPSDTETLMKYAEALDELGKKKGSEGRRFQAYLKYEQLLTREPDRKDIRERCISLAMDSLGRYTEARDHLKILLGSGQDAELEHKLGVCEEMRKDLSEAKSWFSLARDHAPTELKNYLRLAHIYQELEEKPKKARETLNDMVTRNPKNAKAHLERARILLALAGTDKELQNQAAEAIEEARLIAPGEENVFLMQAQLARVRGKSDEARKLYRDGIKAHPKSVVMHFALIQLEVKEKKLDRALEIAEQGLKTMPKENDLLFATAELLIDKGDLKKPLALIDQLREANYPSILTDYLTARLHVQRQEWSQAEQLLSGLRKQLTSQSRVLLGGVDFLLGLCYEKLGNTDQSLFIYQEAVKHDPANMAARLKVAQSYLSLDRIEDAIREYEQILAFDKIPVGVHQALARVLIQQNLRLPSRSRRWKLVRDHLTKAARYLPDSTDVPLLQAEVILLEDPSRKDEARRLLERARDARPDRVEFWLGLAYLAGREAPEQGLAVLAEAEKNPKLKGRVEVLLARMNFLARRPAKEALKALREMEADAQKRPEEEKNRLLTALARGLFLAQDIDDATRLWKQVALAQPQNLGLRLILCDLALYFNKGPEADRWITDTKNLEGEKNGTFWRYGIAYRLYQQSRPKEDGDPLPEGADKRLTEARAILEDIGKRRPSWPAAAALEGQIDVLQGRTERAIGNLTRAVNLGDRRAVIIRKLVELLIDRKRYADAERAIRKLIDQEQTLLAAGLGRIAVQALLRSEEIDRALELALKSVPTESKNYKDHLWLGQILWTASGSSTLLSSPAAVRRKGEAKRELATACELGPTAPETWETYCYYLASTEDHQEAEEVLKRAQKMLPRDNQPLTLAHCYAVLGKLAEAEKQFKLALANPPKGRNVPRELADFYLRTAQLDKAEPMVRDFMRPERMDISPEQRAWARRNLAIILGSRQEYSEFRKALELIAENQKADPGNKADQRAEAVLKATHLGHRAEAIRLLEDLNRTEPLSGEERFLLVKLYAAMNNRARLWQHVVTLVNGVDGKKPMYYAYYIQVLLRTGEVAEAASWTKQLEDLAPHSPLTSEIKIRLLFSQGKHGEAVTDIKRFADQKAENFRAALVLFDEFSQSFPAGPYRRVAEDFYRQSLSRDKGEKPAVDYAYFLGRNGRLSEAMDLCDKALTTGKAETILGAAAGILRGNPTAHEYFPRVEHWIQDKLKNNRRPAALWNILADIYDLEGRHGEAIDLYRKVLKENPENFLALNNLSWLLALRDKNEEALGLMQRLLELAGPVPEFQDTRGVIFLTFHKTKEAIRELEEASERNPSAGTWFHLAQAYYQNKDKRRAEKALQSARLAGLRASRVHPLEREEVARLEAALGVKQAKKPRSIAN